MPGFVDCRCFSGTASISDEQAWLKFLANVCGLKNYGEQVQGETRARTVKATGQGFVGGQA